MSERAPGLERWLFAANDWVPVPVIAREFGIRERELRSDAGRPGLASAFAISSDKGLRHVARATEPECVQFFARLRAHGIAELVRVKNLRRTRANLRAEREPIQTLGGQLLLTAGLLGGDCPTVQRRESGEIKIAREPGDKLPDIHPTQP